MRDFYQAMRVNVVRMAFDSGLAASRNALVREIREDYFLLCDDDFVLGPCSNVDDAVSVLENASDIAVIGGRLHDVDHAGERVRNWEMYFQYDRRNRSFTAIPIYNYSPVVRSVANIDVYVCDAVLNFCIFRKSVFSDHVKWDEHIKINGEHEDFYLNLKLNTKWQVAYLPTMAALHCQPVATGGYKTSLRNRQQGWRYFLEKWEIDQHLEVGTGVRGLGQPTRQWFIDFPALESAHGTLVWEAMPGRAPARPDAGIAFLRLRSRVVKQADTPSSLINVQGSLPSLQAPYGDVEPYGADAPLLQFCYAPYPTGEGLMVWCRPSKSENGDGIKGDLYALHFRWFDSEGKTLIWEGDGIDVELHEGYWLPIVTPLPLRPVGAQYLRFEIVAERGEERVPAAIGFLFSSPQGRPNEEQAEVMAFSVPRQWARSVSAQLRSLIQDPNNSSTSVRKLEVTTEKCSSMAAIDLTQEAVANVRRLLFLDWDGMGRHLVALDIGRAGFELASRLGMPRARNGESHVLGTLKSGEHCRFDILAVEQSNSSVPYLRGQG